MTDEASKHLLVLTNMPDRETAIKLARSLVGKRLAACANVMDGCSSIFRWHREIQSDREIPVPIKTRADRFASLQNEILAPGPYEHPEIIAVPVEAGIQPYLDWVSAEVDTAAQTRTGGGAQ